MIKRAKVIALQIEFVGSFKSWTEELFADAVGVLLTGPSYLYSFGRVLGGFYMLDGYSNTHPPTALRIHLIATLIEQQGLKIPGLHNAVLEGWIDEARKIHNALAYRTTTSETKLLSRTLVAAVVAAFPEIVSSAKVALGDGITSLATLQDDQRRAGIYGKTGIPPIEFDESPDLDQPGIPLEAERLFSICWLAFVNADTEKLSQADKRSSRHASALLEALDAGEALRTWRSNS